MSDHAGATQSAVRKRTTAKPFKDSQSRRTDSSAQEGVEEKTKAKVKDVDVGCVVGKGTFWLTRIVLLRYLGFIYCKCTYFHK